MMAKKAKQTKMQGDGFDDPKAVPSIEKAAEKYVDARDERMELTKKEVEARTVLIHEMRKHKRDTYHYDGKTITIEATDKVKVKSDRASEEETEESEE